MKMMKKFLNKIYSAFSTFLDKVIVTPISKVVFKIIKKSEYPGKQFENWLSKSNTLLFVSLLIAIVAFILIDQRIIKFSESSAEVFPKQEISVLYDEDNYVVEGIPDTVDITLIGTKTDLYIAKQSSSNDVTIDLWGLKPGTHKVDIKYNQILGSIKYSVNPSVATVVIYEKVSSTKTLSVDLLNQDMLDETYIIDKVSSTIDSVVVKGASYKIEKVATVKALVDANALPKFELGQPFTVSSTLKAYDELGNVVDVEISPAKVDVQILISSPSKQIPFQVIPQGKVIYTMGISNFTINGNSGMNVTIYGSEEVLSKIEYIPIEINVDGLTESTEFKVELKKPTGVKSMSLGTATIKVTLSNDISHNTIENVNITATNLGSGYGVTPIDIDSVNVKIKGVTDIIKDINADDITAYVDLNSLGAGTHDVEIKVRGKDQRIEYQSEILKMKVRIYQK